MILKPTPQPEVSSESFSFNIVTTLSSEHDLNIPLPTVSTEAGRVIYLIFSMPENAPSPIVLSDEPSSSVLRFTQPENASLPTDRSELLK